MEHEIPQIVQWIGTGLGAALSLVARSVVQDWREQRRVNRELEREGRAVEREGDSREKDPFGQRVSDSPDAERLLLRQLAEIREQRDALARELEQLKPKLVELGATRAELAKALTQRELLEARVFELMERIKEYESGAYHVRLEDEIAALKRDLRKSSSEIAMLKVDLRTTRSKLSTPVIPPVEIVDVKEIDATRTVPVPPPPPLPRAADLPTQDTPRPRGLPPRKPRSP